MKNILSAIFFCLTLISSNAQSGKKFEYKATRFESIIVVPKFDQSKGQGKQGLAEFSDKDYANNLVYDIIKSILPKEKLLKVNLASGFSIYFSTTGDVINCSFGLNPQDTGLISDEDLFNLYTKFKKTKIDMNIVKITGGSDASPGEKYDYASITGSLVPPEYRNVPRFNR